MNEAQLNTSFWKDARTLENRTKRRDTIIIAFLIAINVCYFSTNYFNHQKWLVQIEINKKQMEVNEELETANRQLRLMVESK